MSESRPEQVKRLFLEAAELRAVERAKFLDANCAADPQLRAEVDELLRYDSTQEDQFLEGSTPADMTSAANSAVELLDAAEHFGPFHPLRILGEGGMGVVYEAQQDQPRRLVALKVIRAGRLTPAILRRFEHEAQVLGQLKHPNIAQIYEAGKSNRGRPYFAMELVGGAPLTDYCRQNGLGLRARLELFIIVCEAVEHAHQRGVIHRDLKPGNILVEVEEGFKDSRIQGLQGEPAQQVSPSNPQPKILDFGIAKATAASGLDQTALTLSHQFIGTPAYMSPEQMGGDAAQLDARTDIYALGVLLYELLANRLPYEIHNCSIPDAIRIVREEEPSRLDITVSGVKPGHHDRDLETIVFKALEKDPERRYASAAALTADLRRYLRDEPIVARPASAWYQLRKFAKRNKTLVVGVAGTFAALAAGLVASLILYFQAETAWRGEARQAELARREAARATAVKDYLLKDLLTAAAPDREGHDAKVVDVINKAANNVATRFHDEPLLEAEIRGVLANVLSQLALEKQALPQNEAQIAMLERYAGRNHPDTIIALHGLASTLNGLREHARSETITRDALARAEGVFGPDDPNRLKLLSALGEALQSQSKHTEAEPILRDVLARMERIFGEANSETLVAMSYLGASFSARGMHAEAAELNRRLYERGLKAYGEAHPATMAALNNLVSSLIRLKRDDEALQYAPRLLEQVDKAFPPEHPARGVVRVTYGQVLRRTGRFEEAEKQLLIAYEMTLAIFGDGRYETEKVVNHVRDLYTSWNKPAEADEWGLRTVEYRFRIAGPGEGPSVEKALRELAQAMTNRGRADAADYCARALIARGEAARPAGHANRARYFGNLGRALLAVQRHELAEMQLLTAEQALANANDPNDDRRLVWSALAALAQTQGKPERAAEWQKRLTELR